MKITEFSEVFKTFSNIYNRIPEIEQNVVVDNDYYIENDFNKPRKYDNLYNFIHNRTTINNNSNTRVLINSAYFHIKYLKKYEYEEVVLDYGLNRQSFLIYAINNGNLPSNKKNIIIETYAYLEGGSKKLIKSCNIEYQLSVVEIKCVFEEDLELDLKKIFASIHDYIGLIPVVLVNFFLEENV